MPLFGALDTAAVLADIPTLAHLDTEPWPLPRAEILQLSWEVPLETVGLLPKAMHPAIPSYATVMVTRFPESPVGPFLLAQVRLMGRAGAHPRGFVLGAVATTPEAVAGLREGWGLPAVSGSVMLRRYHDRVTATVVRDGTTVLDAALLGPETISGSDVQYIHTVTLARVPLDGEIVPRLIQVDPRYTFHRAERGRPAVRAFDPGAWRAPGLDLEHPIAATASTCDTDLPQIRFVMDPEIPVIKGTHRIR